MRLIGALWLTISPPLFIAVCVSSAFASSSSPRFPDRYDAGIESAARSYLPGVPWRLLKAQYWQESRLKPEARSPVGAEGIAQFMPGTWDETLKAMGVGAISRRSADISIRAGAFYMARLRSQWSSPRPWEDRHRLALASYNAGLGNILTAQRVCGGPLLYDPIMTCLPQVTGRHAAETLGYAPAIWKAWGQMESSR